MTKNRLEIVECYVSDSDYNEINIGDSFFILWTFGDVEKHYRSPNVDIFHNTILPRFSEYIGMYKNEDIAYQKMIEFKKNKL